MSPELYVESPKIFYEEFLESDYTMGASINVRQLRVVKQKLALLPFHIKIFALILHTMFTQLQ